MINSLATALGVAVLSMNAPTTTTTHEEPTRAYYEENGSYGTAESNFYNYSSNTIFVDGGALISGDATYTMWDSGIWTINHPTGDGGDVNYFTVSDYEGSFDLYLNGSFITTLEPDSNGDYHLPNEYATTNSDAFYCWLFDHHEQPTLNEGIFEVVGDTITEGAGVVGNGFASLVGIFWDGSSLTGMGILSLITLGISIVWFSFSYVTGLIRKR